MRIEVLGTGCANCRRLEAHVHKALEETGITAEVAKVEDIAAIMAYGVMATPALAVDGTVVVSGRVPSPSQIGALLQGRV
jgi:small redox-active disulfide protein 2